MCLCYSQDFNSQELRVNTNKKLKHISTLADVAFSCCLFPLASIQFAIVIQNYRQNLIVKTMFGLGFISVCIAAWCGCCCHGITGKYLIWFRILTISGHKPHLGWYIFIGILHLHAPYNWNAFFTRPPSPFNTNNFNFNHFFCCWCAAAFSVAVRHDLHSMNFPIFYAYESSETDGY